MKELFESTAVQSTLRESDDLTPTLRRIGKSERFLADCDPRKSNEYEPLDTKQKKNHGWLKQPKEVHAQWLKQILFEYVPVKHNEDGDVKGQGHACTVMRVDRENNDLYVLRLKEVGVDIKAETAQSKLDAHTAVYALREGTAHTLPTSGLEQPIMFSKDMIQCQLEGDWIVELNLEKVSDEDFFRPLTGKLCAGSCNTEQLLRAQDVGRHWFYNGRYRTVPRSVPRMIRQDTKARNDKKSAPKRICKTENRTARSRPQGSSNKKRNDTTDVLKPSNNNHRVSKPPVLGKSTKAESTVTRAAADVYELGLDDTDPEPADDAASQAAHPASSPQQVQQHQDSAATETKPPLRGLARLAQVFG